MNITILDNDICTAVRSYIKSIAPTLPALQTPVNKASMPNGPYVAFTPGIRRPLSTNVPRWDASTRTVQRQERMSFQIDCYGTGSRELADEINMLFRDQYAIDSFALSNLPIVPLYAGDIQQAPFVDDADQYEDRYTFEIELQINPAVTVAQQSCNMLSVTLKNVDRSH